MDNKLTDSEIVNALEDFINHNGHCVDCPSIMKYAFDLINRLQAENSKLKKSNRNWRRKVQRLRNRIGMGKDK